MSIRKAMMQEDLLRRRKRVGWLGWLTICVLALLLLALSLLVWRTASQQPVPLSGEQSVGKITQGRVTTNRIDLVNSPAGAPAVPPKTWTVWQTRDAIGQQVWDSAPEVKAWVIRDYLAALAWTDEHHFELTFEEQNMDQYYTGTRLAEMRNIVAWELQNKKVFAVSTVKRLPLGTLVATFSPDGKTATLLDYHAAGVGQWYDLDTRASHAGQSYPNTIHMIEMTYDEPAQRWKIACERMDYDLDHNQVIWQDK